MVEQVKSFDELPAAISIWPGLGQALGVSRATAYKIVKREGFPVVRISDRKTFIPKDKLQQYINRLSELGCTK